MEPVNGQMTSFKISFKILRLYASSVFMLVANSIIDSSTENNKYL